MQRTLLKEINILEDKQTVRKMLSASLILFVVFAVLIPLLAYIFYQVALKTGDERVIDFPLIFVTLAVYLLSLPAHELIHALFFKLFSPGGKITLGYKNGMLYAGSLGNVYTRRQYLVIALAPFVVLTLVYVVIALAFKAPLTAYLCFALHTSGCVGDFYYAKEILADKRITHCEDTNQGVNFYTDKPAAPSTNSIDL